MATTVFNSGSGNWAGASTWRGSMIPTAADSVVLDFFDLAQPNQVYQVDLAEGLALHDLTIIDSNVLNVSSSASLSLDVLLIGRGSRLTGTATVQAAGSVHNNGTIDTTLSTGLEFTGATRELVNAGTLSVSESGLLQVGTSIGLYNSGLISAAGSGRINLHNITNSGVISSAEAAWISVSGATHNTGKIEAAHGQIILAGLTENAHGGQLLVSDGGTLAVAGQVTGGLGIISGKGSLLFLGSSFQDTTTSVAFHGPGTFLLRSSANYAGTIDGFGAGDRIGVSDVTYAPGGNSYDPQSGLLAVGTTRLQLVGTYAADDFTFRADDVNGGTLVTFNLLGATAALTVDVSDIQIGSLYVAFLGRAADSEGLAYWHDELTAGHGSPDALARIAESFSGQAEAMALHSLLGDPQHVTPADVMSFIDSLYANLFGRAPDAEGAGYWQQQLASNLGEARGVGNFVLDVINGAHSEDAATIANRAEAAAFFSDRLGEVDLAYDEAADALARAEISGVTADSVTLEAAEAAMAAFVDSQVLVPLTGIPDLPETLQA